jgi:hydroxyquinol 1,2-dioxygenase
MRAPHLHFKVSADGMQPLVTHVFVAGPDAATDSVFGLRDSLVRGFERLDATTATPDGRPVTGTWTRVRFEIVLAEQRDA